jgi:hypothetical protein
MNKLAADRMNVGVAATGVALSAIAFLVAGPAFGLGTAVGAIVALANWSVIQWIVGRVTGGTTRSQAGFMLLLVAKMGALMALVYVVLSRGWIQPIAFAVGMSALFGGLIAGSVLYLGGERTAEDKP